MSSTTILIVTLPFVAVAALIINQWVVRRRVRRALREMVGELFIYDKYDACWNPMGSLSKLGMRRLVEVVVRDKLSTVKTKLTRQEINLL